MADNKKLDQTPTKVVAIQRGHDGRRSIEVGEPFTVPAYRLTDGSTWFVREAAFVEPKPQNPLARPPGAGPVKGSAALDEEGNLAPGAGPVPGAGPNSASSAVLA